MNVQEELKNYIVKEFIFDESMKDLSPSEDLLNKGIIDSMGVLQIVGFLEERFGVRVEDDEITPTHFRSLETLTNFVQSKNAVQ